MSTNQRWVLGLTAAASLLVVLDALVVSTALSTIRLDLHASAAELEWTVNAYALSFAVLLMTAAVLGDRLGRRRILTTGIGVFAAASAGCALAPGIGWLIAFRALQGAGAALVMPVALALLGATFSAELRPRALGVFGAVSGLSVPLGPLLGGAVVEGISWPWIFWLNLPAGLVLAVLVRLRIEESHGPRGAIDLPGLALVTGAALGIVWGLVRGNAAGWGSPEVLAALIAGALLTGGFVVRERVAAAPMLPLRLFASRRFSAGNGAAFFHWGSTFGAVFFMSQFLQTGLGNGPLGAGLRLMPWGATTIIVPQVVGRLIGRLGEQRFVVGGMALHAAAMVWIAVIAAPDVAYARLVVPLVLSGAGVAMSLPATQSAVLGAVEPADIGRASGTFSTLRQLGGAFGVAVLVAVFGRAGGYGSPQAFTDGFVAAIAACAGLAVAAALAGAALPGRRTETTSQTEQDHPTLGEAT
ncbi:MFS transporter [Conexibacter woesei]|uniref:MFS transporter n=1 Tax=Conexibacter woesei TaxID=191495 RepID=UPI00068582D2|nr:MFS transporter [Conexibacter woesei]